MRGPDADDVCQEVFAAASLGLAGFRRDRAGDTFRGWLRGVARHKVMDHYRRSKNAPDAAGGTDARLVLEQVPVADRIPPDDPIEERSALYHRALDLVRGEFEAGTWVAFWRTAVDGLPAAVVAAELGVSAAAVRMAKSRVLRRLREEVGELID